MPDYEKLLKANLPDPVEEAYETLNRSYDHPEQLLQADVTLFERLDCCVFCYFTREDVFYVNKTGRDLLHLKCSELEVKAPKSPPIFWLEDDPILLDADRYVLGRARSINQTRELVTLAWGKTWLEGSKLPIQSITGQPMAILFAGSEMAPSKQIKQIAEQYNPATQPRFGDN